MRAGSWDGWEPSRNLLGLWGWCFVQLQSEDSEELSSGGMVFLKVQGRCTAQ